MESFSAPLCSSTTSTIHYSTVRWDKCKIILVWKGLFEGNPQQFRIVRRSLDLKKGPKIIFRNLGHFVVLHRWSRTLLQILVLSDFNIWTSWSRISTSVKIRWRYSSVWPCTIPKPVSWEHVMWNGIMWRTTLKNFFPIAVHVLI